ncbi:MAG: hypothetical protein COA58_02885 [Bacteroidetes bacterium]|nr:MAG: hypothetical protein COA58_02885 [Bacteroidota bacterium]
MENGLINFKPMFVGIFSFIGMFLAELTSSDIQEIEGLLMTVVKWIIAGLTIYSQVKFLRKRQNE